MKFKPEFTDQFQKVIEDESARVLKLRAAAIETALVGAVEEKIGRVCTKLEFIRRASKVCYHDGEKFFWDGEPILFVTQLVCAAKSHGKFSLDFHIRKL